ncbi:MAG: hypothetical protein QHH75_12400 [Bacillota bacterium]|nr:hypothetical protein [Bacillota bacterium]
MKYEGDSEGRTFREQIREFPERRRNQKVISTLKKGVKVRCGKDAYFY